MRYARTDPPLLAGEYWGWIDPDQYGPPSHNGWQRIRYDGQRWWTPFGLREAICWPAVWMRLEAAAHPSALPEPML